MNIELKPIAESKVRQLGGDVCGVLVRNEAGAYASVDEHGRVKWLDSWGEATLARPDGWVRCEDRLPEPRRQSRKTPNGILAKFSNGRISHFREVTETLATNMKNGPRQVLKFETPKPPRIVEWLDLDSPQPPAEQEGSGNE